MEEERGRGEKLNMLNVKQKKSQNLSTQSFHVNHKSLSLGFYCGLRSFCSGQPADEWGKII